MGLIDQAANDLVADAEEYAFGEGAAKISFYYASDPVTEHLIDGIVSLRWGAEEPLGVRLEQQKVIVILHRAALATEPKENDGPITFPGTTHARLSGNSYKVSGPVDVDESGQLMLVLKKTS